MKVRPDTSRSPKETRGTTAIAKTALRQIEELCASIMAPGEFHALSTAAQRVTAVSVLVQAILQPDVHHPGVTTEELLKGVGVALAGVTSQWSPVQRRQAVDLVLFGLADGAADIRGKP